MKNKTHCSHLEEGICEECYQRVTQSLVEIIKIRREKEIEKLK